MKRTQWKPSVLKAFAESDRLVADLESGRVTREELIEKGELQSVDAFLRKLHMRCEHVSR